MNFQFHANTEVVKCLHTGLNISCAVYVYNYIVNYFKNVFVKVLKTHLVQVLTNSPHITRDTAHTPLPDVLNCYASDCVPVLQWCNKTRADFKYLSPATRKPVANYCSPDISLDVRHMVYVTKENKHS